MVKPSGIDLFGIVFLIMYERSRFEAVGDVNSRFYQRHVQQQCMCGF